MPQRTLLKGHQNHGGWAEIDAQLLRHHWTLTGGFEKEHPADDAPPVDIAKRTLMNGRENYRVRAEIAMQLLRHHLTFIGGSEMEHPADDIQPVDIASRKDAELALCRLLEREISLALYEEDSRKLLKSFKERDGWCKLEELAAMKREAALPFKLLEKRNLDKFMDKQQRVQTEARRKSEAMAKRIKRELQIQAQKSDYASRRQKNLKSLRKKTGITLSYESEPQYVW